MKQLVLLSRKSYKKRKVVRAIATKRGNQNHVVLKAAVPILRRHRGVILRSIRETQDRFGMRIRALAVMPDHLHLVIQVDRRAQFADSLRMLAGTIARRIMKKGKLWRQRAWSRIAGYGRDLLRVTRYVAANPVAAGLELDAYLLLDGVLLL